MNIVLFGAGSAGRYCLKYLRSKGIEPFAFADNNADKWNTTIHGIPVMSPYSVNAPDAEWVVTAISRPAATEIRAQLKSMGVKTKPLYECLEVFHGLPSERTWRSVLRVANDSDAGTLNFLWDQYFFRKNPDYDNQCPPSDCKDIYFPDFIKHLDDEHFVDCGAADGDTVKAFLDQWEAFRQITAFEPDESNYRALCRGIPLRARQNIDAYQTAVSDRDGDIQFVDTGDYSAHVGTEGSRKVSCVTLDCGGFRCAPTYIKFDIEGAELQALWGARRILKEHSPVLAVCAYHTSDHLWEIPLLIHAIQPDYRLFFRRYAEGAWEIVWYAVPPERVK